MSIKLLRLLVGLLVIVAVVLAVLGWRISQQPAEPPSVQAPRTPAPAGEPREPAAPAHPVVVAARDLSLGQALDPEGEALRVVDYPVPVPDSFASLDELGARRLTRPVAEGDVLRPEHFAAGGVMAEVIPPGKRAVAVGVDEVIGGGGFLSPGDRVDVLYQARADEGDQPQLARRLFEDVQVVSYGEALEGVEPADDEAAGPKRRGRSAVLAVKGEQAATLLLAETTGRLRLAVIGAEEHRQRRLREADDPAAPGPGLLPVMAGLPGRMARPGEQAEPRRDDEEALPPALAGLGPAVLFEELTHREESAATETPGSDERAPRRRAGRDDEEAPPVHRVTQYVGGEVRVVELPESR
ncbi:MAG: Flp pilus assembly protein CpaB [Pseudomonadota bacterium]